MNSLPVRLFHGSLFGIFIGALAVSMFHGIQQRFQKPPELERVVEIDKEGQSPSAPAASPGTPTPDDLDGDGIPNTWETANCMNPNNADDAESDFDFDGLSAFQEYELSIATESQYGNPLGKYSLVSLPNPGGFALNSSQNPIISSRTLIECAGNGMTLIRIRGILAGQTAYTYSHWTYDPNTSHWTMVRPPAEAPPSATIYATDVNSQGQVVGYYSDAGYKGFIWTPNPLHPNGGESNLFFVDPDSSQPTPAVPRRISDTGYMIYGTSPGGEMAADPHHNHIEPIIGAWITPHYVDVNDYGEYVGYFSDPETWALEELLLGENRVFLAIHNGPTYVTEASNADLGDGGLPNIPNVNYDTVEWVTCDCYDLTGNFIDSSLFWYATTIDLETQQPLELLWSLSDGSVWWREAAEEFGSNAPWNAVDLCHSIVALNDWGEFAGGFSSNVGSLELQTSYQNDGTGNTIPQTNPNYSIHSQSGLFYFDGKYHFTSRGYAVLGISNDPRVLLRYTGGLHLWADSVIAPLTKLVAVPSSVSSARICDNGRIVIQSSSTTVKILEPSDDADADGMPDDWEKFYLLDPNNAADASEDSDDDGYSNLVEFQMRTVPRGEVAGTAEDLRPGIDSDGDGMPNTWEWKYGFDGNDASDALGDLDGDGLSNLKEFLLGSSPSDPDTDGDGIPDGSDSNPLVADTVPTNVVDSIQIWFPFE